MTVIPTPKDPTKCALKILPQLFSNEEMAEGTLEVSKKSKRKLLNIERTNKMFGMYMMHCIYECFYVEQVICSIFYLIEF